MKFGVFLASRFQIFQNLFRTLFMTISHPLKVIYLVANDLTIQNEVSDRPGHSKHE